MTSYEGEEYHDALETNLPQNTKLTEEERELITSMKNGENLVKEIDEYDAEFEKMKDFIESNEAQPFNLSGYTAKLDAFRVLLIEKIVFLQKKKLTSLSKIEDLYSSLIQKLSEATALYNNVTINLSVVNTSAEYKALGVKIAELETLINGINDSANAPAGGRKKSKTKSRGKRNIKKTKTKRVKRTKTRKIKRRGGKCNCSLWSK